MTENPFTELPATREVGTGLTLASPWARLAARCIDQAAFWLPVLAFVCAGLSGVDGADSLAGAVGVAWVLVEVSVQVWLLSMGTSIGKRALGLTIVDGQGRPLGFVRAGIVRELARWGMVLIPYIGVIFALTDGVLVFCDERRTLHDRAAGSWVVTDHGTGPALVASGRKGLPTAAVVALVVVPVLLALAGIAAFAAPGWAPTRADLGRAEAIANVNGILAAERTFREAHGGWAAAGSEQAARDWAPDHRARDWPGGPDWDALGWRPDGNVRCAYWVEVLGDDLRARALCDADGDGHPALIEGTDGRGARALDPDLY